MISRRPNSVWRRPARVSKAPRPRSAATRISCTDSHPAGDGGHRQARPGRRDLEHTDVRAPADGVISQTDRLHGRPVHAGRHAGPGAGRDRRHLDRGQLQGNRPHPHDGRPDRRRSNSTPIPATSFTARSRASAPAPARSSRCCRRRTRPATGSRSSSACRSGSRSRRAGRRAAPHRHERHVSKSIPATQRGLPSPIRSALAWTGIGSAAASDISAATSGQVRCHHGHRSSIPASPVKHAGLITVSIMLATIMQVLDTTIANVALPHMQGEPRRRAGQDHLGADLLHRRRRHRDAAHRLARRPDRPQARCS